MTQLKNNRNLIVLILFLVFLLGIGYPIYINYTDNRAMEPITLLPQIALKQEAYFQEFQRYLSTPKNPPDAHYKQLCKNGKAKWIPNQTAWQNIGFHPPHKSVHFQYWVEVGTKRPKKATLCNGQIVVAMHYPPGFQKHWFVVCARGDLYRVTCNPKTAPFWFGMSNSPVYSKRVFYLRSTTGILKKLDGIQILSLSIGFLALFSAVVISRLTKDKKLNMK